MIKLTASGGLSIRSQIQKDISQILESLARNFVQKVQSNIIKQRAVDRGILLRSFRIQRPDPLTRKVVSTARHAPAVEWGRPPGRLPPVDVIQEWVIRKGVMRGAKQLSLRTRRRRLRTTPLGWRVAWAVAKKIQKRGIRERPYWRPAIVEIERRAKQIRWREILLRR